MTPEAIYKAILGSITQVRNTRIERNTAARAAVHDTPDDLVASDSLLDEMARNVAQVIVSKLDEEEQHEEEEAP